MSLYYIFNYIAVLVLVAYNLSHYKRKKLILGKVSHSVIERFEPNRHKAIGKLFSSVAFWVVLETLIISAAQYVGVFNSIVGNLLDTGANYFGMLLFTPWLVVLMCVLLKIDPLAQLDLIAPAYPLALFFSKIACHFAGCCRGVRWIYGFYNPTSRLIEFPIQLLEAVVALLLFILIFCLRKKFKKGTVFPFYCTIYSFIRFFTEFLRVEPEVFMGLKTYHFLCIIGVVVGIVEYIAARKYDAYTQSKVTEPLATRVVGG